MSKKRGAKPRAQALSTELVTFRLTPQEKKCLELYGWRYEQSMSETIRSSLSILGVLA